MDKKEKMNKIVELYKQGKGARLISKELNIPKTTVQRYLKKSNIEIRKHRNKKLTDVELKEIIDKKYPNFQYVGGYTNGHGKMVIQCKACGYKFAYTAEIIRPSRDANIQCDNCIETIKLRDRLINILNKLYTEQMRITNKEQSMTINEEVESLKRIAKKHRYYLECEECGRMYFTNRNDTKTCSKRCINKRNNRIKEINRRKIIKENGRIDWDITLDKLIERDKNICYICNGECNKEDYILDKDNNFIVGSDYPSIDHVIPISKGGTHTWDNVRLAHHHCNSIKKDSIVNEGETG